MQIVCHWLLNDDDNDDDDDTNDWGANKEKRKGWREDNPRRWNRSDKKGEVRKCRQR